MYPELWLGTVVSVAGRTAGALVAYAAAGLNAAFTRALGWFPWMPEVLPQLPELCTLCLAVVVLLLCRRVRRDRMALRGIAAELERHTAEYANLQRMHGLMEDRVARLKSDLVDLGGRQRNLEARAGKPDSRLAAAMARAGARQQHMVDCGLSHGEVHLLRALNAGSRSSQRSAAIGGTGDPISAT